LVNEVDELNLEMDQDDADDAGALNSTLTKFKDIAAQLLSIRKGNHLPAFQAGTSNLWVPAEQLGPTTPARRLTLKKPNVDSHKSYNGYGLTLPRTGFYLMRAMTNWDSGVVPIEPGFGTYTTVIDVGGTTSWAIDRQEHGHSELRGVHNNVTFLGWAPRGAKVSLRVNQNTDRSIKINSAFLSSIMLRNFE
jgi:hypothetical protein